MFATQPRRRCQMRVLAKQIAELREADASRPGKRRCIGKFMRYGAHPFRQPLEQRNVLVFSAIEKVRTAPLAGPQAQRFRLVFGAYNSDILGFRLARGAGRKAIIARSRTPDQELSGEFAPADSG